MSLEIQDRLRKYCELTEDRSSIDKFVCPVEGCDFSTRLGPGALRMHILMKSDPNIERRYCPSHHEFYRTYQDELGTDVVRYLMTLPRIQAD